MKDFIFHEGSVPPGYSFSFTESLFNQHAHRQLQSKSDWHSFFILNQKDETVDGSIYFHVSNGVANSPFKATYGGFDLHEKFLYQDISQFIIFIEEQLSVHGVTKVFIKLPLRVADENEFNLMEKRMLDRGFKVISKESGCILKVSKSFYSNVHRSERSCLKKSIESHFEFEQFSNDELKNIYSFLQQQHKEKNYNLSMSFQEIQDLVLEFPDKVLLFGVKDKDQIIAASICLRVKTDVLYDFYHNHKIAYNSFSPIVFLIMGINDYCYANQIPLIDLGTAMTGDKVNTGLLAFKLKLGADRAVKYVFEKRYK